MDIIPQDDLFKKQRNQHEEVEYVGNQTCAKLSNGIFNKFTKNFNKTIINIEKNKN